MWLQRILFNLKTRLLGKDDKRTSDRPSIAPLRARQKAEQVALLQQRLADLDRRLALLK